MKPSLVFALLTLLLSTFIVGCKSECKYDDAYYTLSDTAKTFFPYPQGPLYFLSPDQDTVLGVIIDFNEGNYNADFPGPNETEEPCPHEFIEFRKCKLLADSGRLDIRIEIATDRRTTNASFIMNQGTSLPVLVNSTIQGNGVISFNPPELLPAYSVLGTTYLNVLKFSCAHTDSTIFHTTYFKPDVGIIRLEKLNGDAYTLIQ